MKRFTFLSLCLVGFWAVILPLAKADDVEPNDETKKAEESEEAKARLKTMMEALGEYRVEVAGEKGPETAKLLPVPVLRWSNTVSGTKDGIVGMWIARGRPQVIVQFSQRNVFIHEFCSTATGPLTTYRNGQAVWSPAVAGVTMQPIPDAPPPAETAVKRLTQMRKLAERFEVIDDFRPNYADPKTERHTLRLLTKPLYRYEPSSEVIDGAVFGLVITTDPESLLLIEAHKTDKGAEWRYALTRMTVYALTGKLDGEQVWSAPERVGNELRFRYDEPYFVGLHQ
jgi:hypothetical protein